MRKILFGLCLALAGSAFGAEITINFGDFAAGRSPTNFFNALAGSGQPGDWKIVTDESPSAFAPLMPQITSTAHAIRRPVLAQLSQDPADERFPMFIYAGETFKNFKVTTQFKIVSGAAEQMAGIVFRYQNESNFYVVRVSALGKNIAFYKMVNGEIISPVKLSLETSTNVWHQLELECSGTYIDCRLDGQKALPTITDTSPPDGKVGFWTKSDAVSYFGDTTIDYTPVVPAAQLLVRDIMKKYPRILGLRIYTPDDKGQMRILASKDEPEAGQPGTDAEKSAFDTGAIYYGHEKGKVVVDMPLNDRNGVAIATVQVKLKSHALAETQDMVLDRVRIILNAMQAQVLTKEDLMN